MSMTSKNENKNYFMMSIFLRLGSDGLMPPILKSNVGDEFMMNSWCARGVGRVPSRSTEVHFSGRFVIIEEV